MVLGLFSKNKQPAPTAQVAANSAGGIIPDALPQHLAATLPESLRTITAIRQHAAVIGPQAPGLIRAIVDYCYLYEGPANNYEVRKQLVEVITVIAPYCGVEQFEILREKGHLDLILALVKGGSTFTVTGEQLKRLPRMGDRLAINDTLYKQNRVVG